MSHRAGVIGDVLNIICDSESIDQKSIADLVSSYRPESSNGTVYAIFGKRCTRKAAILALLSQLSRGKLVKYVNHSPSLDGLLAAVSQTSCGISAAEEDVDLQKVDSIAVCASRSECIDRICNGILVDVPTVLVLEGADYESCAVMLSDYVSAEKDLPIGAINVFVLQSLADDFTRSLCQNLNRGAKAREIDQGAAALLSGYKVDQCNSASVVHDVQPDSPLFCFDQSDAVVNLIPIRTVKEGISMANKSVYRSNAFIWTDLSSLAFSTCQDLSFTNIRVNSFREGGMQDSPYGIGYETHFLDWPKCRNRLCVSLIDPAATVDSKKCPGIRIRFAPKYKSMESSKLLSAVFTNLFPDEKPCLDVDPSGARMNSGMLKMRTVTPVMKLKAWVAIEKHEDLPAVLQSMITNKWESLYLECVDGFSGISDLVTKSEYFEAEASNGEDVYFSWRQIPQYFHSIRGVHGCELSRLLVYKTCHVKHLSMPFGFSFGN